MSKTFIEQAVMLEGGPQNTKYKNCLSWETLHFKCHQELNPVI